ncbi:Sec-independent protein translocase subunit TatA [Sinomonas sp. JGH33]|uniref:Sec-independent protein translocase protein TatA n=1 Tax=Sinomonas terricola TaxID=3110330 RepID=A0ABU5T4G2_9MICC|nr:Sec-independent protein translocase subunit TatA [Sinomonas sp. JGH33]MEA5454437.1 Sec-independent protein translocase subunit TatA [Sinomonas sp. JGH33]
MGRLFDSPWPIVIIIVVALLLFAAPKLPGMARSLGQSMRILRSEVKEMKNDDGKSASSSSSQGESPVEGKVIPPKGADEGDGGTGGPSQRA